MATDELWPSYVRIDYASPYGAHVMTRPVLRWSGTGVGDPGEIATHSGSAIASDTMIENFIDALMALYLPTSTSVAYSIFNLPLPDDDPQPVFAKSYASAGTADPTGAGSSKAWVATMVFRSTAFGLTKLNLIEAARYSLDGRFSGALTGDFLALSNEFMSTSNGWSARDNGRPAVYMHTNWKPNDRLIRGYKYQW